MLIVRNQHSVMIKGFSDPAQRDIAIPFLAPALCDTAINLAECLASHLEENHAVVVSGEKISWATSVLRFDLDSDVLVARGLNVRTDKFDVAADSVLFNWKGQREICSSVRSQFVSTELLNFLVASPDVESGEEEVAEAVRYPFLLPNSGWWLFGPSYDSDIRTMRKVHVGHVVQRFPQIVPYLALAPGFCFSVGEKPRIWFEKDVAQQSAV